MVSACHSEHKPCHSERKRRISRCYAKVSLQMSCPVTTGKYVKNPAKITGFQSLSGMALGQGGDQGHSQIL